jgi:hypothetical protein
VRTLDRDHREQITEYSAFRDVYRFILGAVGGDASVAKAMYERYLAGELSEELLTISRRCVKEDSVERKTKSDRDGGGDNAFLVVA